MRVAAALTLVVLAVACLQASRALACSATPSPYLTIEAIEPADGSTGFPRNGAVGVALKFWPVTDDRDSGQLQVRVSVADSGESVEGIVNKFSQASALATWTPNAPLRANTRYRVEVTTIATRRPSGATGQTTATSTFTTSDALAPQLELVGTLRATLRQGVADLLKCGPCGQCMKIGERPALLADIELPVIQAGFDKYGYQAWFTLNDKSAHVRRYRRALRDAPANAP
ncbi:MAG TPA: Ig-like domain-containing protein [Polyangiales bacterium]|nr:Ig-like domain-containing protein [Polyangiales bacterium]